MKVCPYCAEQIQDAAIVCKHCGRDLTPRALPSIGPVTGVGASRPSERLWNPGVAAVLSFIVPGLGQIYKGEVGYGMAWLVIVILGYFVFIVPGLLLHIWCIVSAAGGDPYYRR